MKALGCSIPKQPANGSYPPLALDIDPDTLSSSQMSQLNASRGHLGTAHSRVIAATALVAEQQAATETMHDSIQDLRGEMLSRVDSLRNEVNSRRSRLNRVIDDNLRIVLETGASGSQIKNLLHTMSQNGGVHRVDRPPPAIVEVPVVAPQESIPANVRAAVDSTVTPRTVWESRDEFERRAHGVLRAKENALAAFPLPKDSSSVPMGPHVAQFVPPASTYESIGSASRAHLRFDETRAVGQLRKARVLDKNDRRTRSTPVAMNN
ncbi:hypothetical protein B0H14DRAFT_2571518 [Mycena olivaceomarginata]|nr:hypothetical protein B0H14DRAFT_2571518 [Mycena olivaceomarginata]